MKKITLEAAKKLTINRLASELASKMNKPTYVIKYFPAHADVPMYVEPSEKPEWLNFTEKLSEAKTWNSLKRAQNYADRWVLPISGWNAQTDTQGVSGKRQGVSVVEK